jgi:hypothetical protein
VWEPRCLTALWAFTACYRESFAFISRRTILPDSSFAVRSGAVDSPFNSRFRQRLGKHVTAATETNATMVQQQRNGVFFVARAEEL